MLPKEFSNVTLHPDSGSDTSLTPMGYSEYLNTGLDKYSNSRLANGLVFRSQPDYCTTLYGIHLVCSSHFSKVFWIVNKGIFCLVINFLTACKKLWRLCVLAGTSDSKKLKTKLLNVIGQTIQLLISDQMLPEIGYTVFRSHLNV